MRPNPLPFALSLLAVVLCGCATLQTGAPPVTPAMTRIATTGGGSADTLNEGRRLLAMRCTSCHGLEPVGKYSVSEWRSNVAKMSGRAGLSEAEKQEITAYLVAARQSLDGPW